MYMYVGVIMNAQQNMWWKLVEHTNQIDTIHARYQRVRQDAGGGPGDPGSPTKCTAQLSSSTI